jgi:hypothetical protein
VPIGVQAMNNAKFRALKSKIRLIGIDAENRVKIQREAEAAAQAAANLRDLEAARAFVVKAAADAAFAESSVGLRKKAEALRTAAYYVRERWVHRKVWGPSALAPAYSFEESGAYPDYLAMINEAEALIARASALEVEDFARLQVPPPPEGYYHPTRRVYRVSPTIYIVETVDNTYHIEIDGGGDAVISEGEAKRMLNHALKNL